MTATDPTEVPWRDLAACLHVGFDVFFPHPTDDVGIARAKGYCARCPVDEPCLEQALAQPGGLDYGVRGGMTDSERASLRRRLRRRRAIEGGAT